MSDAQETTYVTELLVPLTVLMLDNGESPEDLFTYGDIYEAANRHGIVMSETDHNWWQKRQNYNIESSKIKMGINRSIEAGTFLFYDFYGACLPSRDAELVGRNNENFPPDFRLGEDLFSLKDESTMLWNTTPKSLFPYIKPDIADAIDANEILYLQGVPVYKKDGSIKQRQPAYDWFLYADHDLCQNNYRNLLWSLFRFFYDIKMWHQPEWDPQCGRDEWWTIDKQYGDAVPVTGDFELRGSSAIPLDTPERLVFINEFADHYELYLYDGFDENDYPTTFLGIRNTKKPTIGIIPIVFYNENMDAFPYFDGQAGMGIIQVEDILHRSDFCDNEEYIPFYNFSIKQNGNKVPMTQDVAKGLSRFITQSQYSPANKEANFCNSAVPSSLPRPAKEFDSMQTEIPEAAQMSEIEYWTARLKIAASDALSFCVGDILEVDEQEFVSLLMRIYDVPYYYLRMTNNGAMLYMVPGRDDLKDDIYISNISFDCEQANTMMSVTCGRNKSVVNLRVEFRNKGGMFAGAPDMIILYDEATSDLSAIYHPVF